VTKSKNFRRPKNHPENFGKITTHNIVFSSTQTTRPSLQKN
jgi:hypothetical protein